MTRSADSSRAAQMAVGHSYADMHYVTEQMCPYHRMPYLRAMMNVSATMQTLESARLASLSSRNGTEEG